MPDEIIISMFKQGQSIDYISRVLYYKERSVNKHFLLKKARMIVEESIYNYLKALC